MLVYSKNQLKATIVPPLTKIISSNNGGMDKLDIDILWEPIKATTVPPLTVEKRSWRAGHLEESGSVPYALHYHPRRQAGGWRVSLCSSPLCYIPEGRPAGREWVCTLRPAIASWRPDWLENSEFILCASPLHPRGQAGWRRVSLCSVPLHYIQEGGPAGRLNLWSGPHPFIPEGRLAGRV